MPEESPLGATKTTSTTTIVETVTKTATTPSSRRTLSFKMVEEHFVEADGDENSNPKSMKQIVHHTGGDHTSQHGGGSTPHNGGGGSMSTRAATAAEESIHHHLSSGRHSPHIPHLSRPHSPLEWAEPGKVYTQTYLPADHQPTYLLGPHGPNPSKIPNYHTPDGQGVKIEIPRRRRGMDFLVNACVTQLRENGQYFPAHVGGRPRSPHMNNEEPITLSTYPDARPVPLTEEPKIERPDFPAPPYPYTDPERRRRYSESAKKSSAAAATSDTEELDMSQAVQDDDEDDVIVDPGKAAEAAREAEHARREAQELKKISTGIGKVFLHDVEARAKNRQGKWRQGIDPRNASRTASANREPHTAPRYGSPAFASPSRLDDRPRPWEEWEFTPPTSQGGKWRSASSGASTLPSYSIPRPGYGLSTATTPKSATLPQGLGRSSPGIPDLIFEDGTFVSDDIHRTQSGDFASTTLPDFLYSERSARAFLDAHLVRSRIVEPYFQADFLEAVENTGSTRKERKIYPIQQLLVTNRKFPEDVDRNHLELHLSPEDFVRALRMSRADFFRLPDWKRSELKKRAKLY
ncbi:hypothetical protein BV898_00230 [Hypsibius exemplaris]|uniref:HP domain-containing protein n=1 Tax=Hypsibius exemplaris TaxID=2072580 RepID=A0A1W0XFB2_HYPEX|nr:hypothetical protein BV898_00230 [Hypsibius exemplaris]